jgi:DNA-binding response OmpR family regulator
MVQVGELRIDPASREVLLGDTEIELSAKEFALLHALAGDPTRVFTKEELLRDVWGFKLMGTSRRSPMSCVVVFRTREAADATAPAPVAFY